MAVYQDHAKNIKKEDRNCSKCGKETPKTVHPESLDPYYIGQWHEDPGETKWVSICSVCGDRNEDF
jgi:hypothetical protein